jgi:hypothetical protein
MIDHETDHELLELAAKAAGIWDESDPSNGLLKGTGQYWNPLQDNGDALWLAVKLRLCIDPALPNGFTCVYSNMHTLDSRRLVERRKTMHFESELEATRRVIVRAAAEIGRAKPAG